MHAISMIAASRKPKAISKYRILLRATSLATALILRQPTDLAGKARSRNYTVPAFNCELRN